MNLDERQIKILSGLTIFFSGFLFGGVTGYFLDKKKMHKEYIHDANEEIAEVRTYYKKLLKTGVYSSPVTLYVEKYGDPEEKAVLNGKLEDLGYDTEQEKEPVHKRAILLETDEHGMPLYDLDSEGTVTPVRDGLTQRERDQAGYHEHPAVRDRYKPYVISTAEFMDEMEEEHDKVTVTYFRKDDTVCDERDEIMDDVDEKIGDFSLTQFGVRSDDENTVYVRNERLRLDFEVVLDSQSYAEVILGYRGDRETNPGLRKFREEKDE